MEKQNPTIRVVIPAYKAEKTILRCLVALEASLGFEENWEIVVVDNGGNPLLPDLLQGHAVRILKRTEHASAAYARNEGAQGFQQGILVFMDSDVVCEANCIPSLIAPLRQGKCKATIGNYSTNVKGLSFTQTYKQLYINHIYGRTDAPIQNDFWTAICAVDAEVFHELSGFDANFKGANGEDQEFGMRLTRHGHTVFAVNNANGQHLNPYGVWNIVRNDYKKGLKAVQNSFENKVSFADNRHSSAKDILSVFFCVLTLSFLPLLLLNLGMAFPLLLSGLAWMFCRSSLIVAFFRYGNPLFVLRSLPLMFVLDGVRFLCVSMGFIKFKLLKPAVPQESLTISIHP